MQWLAEFPGVWLLMALALYGLVSAIGQGYQIFRWGVRPRSRTALSLLILVQNQEHQIEGFVRALLAHIRGRSTLVGRSELLLVDLASVDETPLILERLVRQDAHLRLVRLPAGASAGALESALFVARSRVAVTVDLRGKVDAADAFRIITDVW